MTLRMRVPERVGVVEERSPGREAVYIARLPDGPIVVLRDTAVTVWQEALSASGRRDDLAARVAARYDIAVSEVEPLVEACLDDLLRRGLLEHAPD